MSTLEMHPCLTGPILFLSPLAWEQKYLVQALESLGFGGHWCEKSKAGTQHKKVWVSTDKKILFACVGALGKVAYALETQKWLLNYYGLQPSVIICVGSAGSLSPDIAVNDVIIGESSVEHDFRSSVLPENPHWPASPSVLQTWRAIAAAATDQSALALKFGKIASGDEDIVSLGRANAIKKQTGALCVAWEGAGGARACHDLGVPYLEIRVVTDRADAQTLQDFKNNLNSAMQSLARLVHLWSQWFQSLGI